ncbi:MAG: alkylhydroperoxidase [Gammaproteobacteria bacterium]|nr:MAG: alkylhydroperoxidase [Gammaproteobacteria bacterium]
MEKQVTKLDLAPVSPLPQRTELYLERCKETLGIVPNVLRAYLFDITKFDAFVAMYNDVMLGESGLTKLEREMVAVVVSSINDCWYCQVAHGAAVRELSGDPALGETLVMNFRAAALDDRTRAMLDFAALVTQDSALVAESHRQALRDHGFSDRDIFDIIAVVAFFSMSNRIASATGMEPNPEYHSMAR